MMQQELYYKEALKLGLKTFRAETAENRSPYLPVLDEIVPPEKALTGIRLGVVDIEYAPARGLNDFETLSHRGFACFNQLMERYRPSYFIHGHIHRNYDFRIPQKCVKGDTTVINAFEYCIIDTEEQVSK